MRRNIESAVWSTAYQLVGGWG